MFNQLGAGSRDIFRILIRKNPVISLLYATLRPYENLSLHLFSLTANANRFVIRSSVHGVLIIRCCFSCFFQYMAKGTISLGETMMRSSGLLFFQWNFA